MGWWKFWDKEQSSGPSPVAARAPGPIDPARAKPRPEPRRSSDPATERRIAQLRQRQAALRYDFAQSELALLPDNPWQDRIDLLGEAIATVEADIASLSVPRPSTRPAISPAPITAVSATAGDLATVTFAIGDEVFRFEEQVDWDQRGGPTVRGDLQPVAGDVERVIDPGFDLDDRRALREHLTDSIAVFATDLRDRALSDEPLPTSPTLADLAMLCPECGGWMDWSGRCLACTRRDIERQRLRVERDRLDADRRSEADERHRLAEGLSTTRRRLTAVATDLTALGVDPE